MVQFKYLNSDEDKIRPEVRALAERGDVTLEEWEAFRGNSWEQELIMKHLTDEALLACGEHLVVNCHFDNSRPWSSYNEAVMGFLAPELMKRLKAANEREAQACYEGAVEALREVERRYTAVAEENAQIAKRYQDRGDERGALVADGKEYAYRWAASVASELASRPRR